MTESDTGKKILVTGASGFLGSHLTRKLVELGYSVRTLGRSSTKPKILHDLDVEHCSGDVTNIEQLATAVDGCDVVFHLAGLVSYRDSDQPRQIGVNVLGTRNIMEVALKHGVKRVIHTSSVAAMGIPPAGTLGDESIEYNLAGQGLNYCDTKYAAELEVKEAYKAGLNVLILNPGIVFGEGDTHPHHHTIFAALAKGSLIGVPPGGVPFSDINDVVDAHVNAMTMGRAGERYVLVSANLTMTEAAEIFARLAGTKPPLLTIPGPLVALIGRACEWWFNRQKKVPPLTRQVAWLAQHKIFFSSKKAEAELNFKATPFEETIRRTADYYLKVAGASDSIKLLPTSDQARN